MREDYDFTRAREIPADRANHRMLALNWELERELGSCEGPFHRSKYARKSMLDGKAKDTRGTGELREIPLSEISRFTKEGRSLSVRAFLFDWTLTERQIVEQFRRWLIRPGIRPDGASPPNRGKLAQRLAYRLEDCGLKIADSPAS